MINITTKNFDAMLKRLEEAEQKIRTAAVQANIAAASEAERTLKQGLSRRAGRKPSDKNYENSPKGSLPYGHTMALRNSIGFKVLRSGPGIKAEFGSGARKSALSSLLYHFDARKAIKGSPKP